MGLFNRKKETEIKEIAFVSSQERRAKNNEFIKREGIACFEDLPLRESSKDVTLKSVDDICKRAIACLLSIQVACDIAGGNDAIQESIAVFSNLLKKYDVEHAVLEKEQRLFNQTNTEQNAIDVAWTYEADWSLLWALGLLPDIKRADTICDCQKAISLVSECASYKAFKAKCHIRNIEEILDMLDLYYRYHWACVEKRVHPDTMIQNLNSEVVTERRRGLEWLIAKEQDWNEISLDT